jgi:hypothetical protein
MATYEMQWDCSSCGTRKLLGKTHRRCPQCGAPQDAKARYFPAPGEEIAAAGHVFVGVDWSCAACQTPNSNAAHFCVSCGNPKDGNVQVAKVIDQPVRTVANRSVASLSALRRSRLPLILACIALASLAACLVTVFWQRDVQVRVTEHAWSRAIDIEQISAVSESSWCDSMPSDAYSVSRSREVRSHRQIADGQDCRTVRSDNGDGTYSTSNQCTTKYRSEPIYDDKCRYTVNRWRVVHTERTQGRGLEVPRVWPDVHVSGGSCMGCQRAGGRRESLTVDVRGTSGADASKAWQCALDEDRWARLRDGDVRTMRVRVVTGGAVCDTLRP